MCRKKNCCRALWHTFPLLSKCNKALKTKGKVEGAVMPIKDKNLKET